MDVQMDGNLVNIQEPLSEMCVIYVCDRLESGEIDFGPETCKIMRLRALNLK